MRNAKADGYAPRCLVAEATAAEVRRSGYAEEGHDLRGGVVDRQRSAARTRRRPATSRSQCVHTGKDAATVRFRLMSPRA